MFPARTGRVMSEPTQNAKTEHAAQEKRHGLPLGRLNQILAAIALILAALLLVATSRADVGYSAMRDSTENYIKWHQSAYKMQAASDYLTDQVRNFAVTGKREFLNNYFKELNYTRRREAALAELHDALGDSTAYADLEQVMKLSESLSERELYAMRLLIQSLNYDVTEFPPEIQNVELEARDLSMSKVRQSERARSMVVDTLYVQKKSEIDAGIQECYLQLIAQTEQMQSEALADLDHLMYVQRGLILTLIVIVLAIVGMTSFLIIRPLLSCVKHIRDEQAIPPMGSYEFRFLANAYNHVFEASRQKKEKLAYDASHDKLTGLYNRAGYDFLLGDVDLETSALLLIDVDKFKHINDNFGHDVGDRVLANVARTLRDAFRSDDCVCRIGGDEFATIMVRSGAQFTDLIRGKIERVNDKLLHPAGDLPPISVSVGVAFGTEGITAGELSKKADLALYQVKENGRCGCAFYEG